MGMNCRIWVSSTMNSVQMLVELLFQPGKKFCAGAPGVAVLCSIRAFFVHLIGLVKDAFCVRNLPLIGHFIGLPGVFRPHIILVRRH